MSACFERSLSGFGLHFTVSHGAYEYAVLGVLHFSALICVAGSNCQAGAVWTEGHGCNAGWEARELAESFLILAIPHVDHTITACTDAILNIAERPAQMQLLMSQQTQTLQSMMEDLVLPYYRYNGFQPPRDPWQLHLLALSFIVDH